MTRLARVEALTRVETLIHESNNIRWDTLSANGHTIVTVAEVIAEALRKGNKVMFCGNGGSAADAQHLAAELLVRLRTDRRPLPALALALDTSTFTACANDYGFDLHYARMVEALGQPGDVLVVFSTSGNSLNVIRALIAASNKGRLTTVGFLGSGGGEALQYCDHAIVVPSEVTGRIQETHITLGHAILELVEDMVLDEAA